MSTPEALAIARGRMALLEGRRRPAASFFVPLLRIGAIRTRAAILLGPLSAHGRTGFEWLVSALGRHSLPSCRHFASRATPLP